MNSCANFTYLQGSLCIFAQVCVIKNIEKWVNIMLVKSPLLLVCGKVFIVKLFWLL